MDRGIDVVVAPGPAADVAVAVAVAVESACTGTARLALTCRNWRMDHVRSCEVRN